MVKKIFFVHLIFFSFSQLFGEEQKNNEKLIVLRETIEESNFKKIQELLPSIKLNEREKLILIDVAQALVSYRYMKLHDTKSSIITQVFFSLPYLSIPMLMQDMHSNVRSFKETLLFGIISESVFISIAYLIKLEISSREQLYEDALKIKEYVRQI